MLPMLPTQLKEIKRRLADDVQAATVEREIK
jgi:hypothetical protein